MVQELFFLNFEDALSAYLLVQKENISTDNWYDEYKKLIKQYIRYTYTLEFVSSKKDDEVMINSKGELKRIILSITPYNNKATGVYYLKDSKRFYMKHDMSGIITIK